MWFTVIAATRHEKDCPGSRSDAFNVARAKLMEMQPDGDKVEWINSVLDEKKATGRGDYCRGVTELIKAQERRDNE